MEEKDETNRNQLVKIEVFKPTNRNATKRLRKRQETRGTTKTSQTAETILKQIATQEFQAEKRKIEV